VVRTAPAATTRATPVAAPIEAAIEAPREAPRAPATGVVVLPPARPDRSRRTLPSRLAAESRAVLEARRALHEGHPEEALRGLEAARAELGEGVLAQEREALTIEALARTGRTDLAAARASSFLKSHPDSPHAATVSAFAKP
jgi:hypothetical protein